MLFSEKAGSVFDKFFVNLPPSFIVYGVLTNLIQTPFWRKDRYVPIEACTAASRHDDWQVWKKKLNHRHPARNIPKNKPARFQYLDGEQGRGLNFGKNDIPTLNPTCEVKKDSIAYLKLSPKTRSLCLFFWYIIIVCALFIYLKLSWLLNIPKSRMDMLTVRHFGSLITRVLKSVNSPLKFSKCFPNLNTKVSCIKNKTSQQQKYKWNHFISKIMV